MKKLFTLLFCTGLASAAFAQSDRERAADAILRGGNNSGTTASYPAGGGNCQARIDAINRRYDAQEASIRANGSLSAAERDRQVSILERGRHARVNEVRNACANGTYTGHKGSGHSESEHRDKDRTKVKGNNGNHYGWEKGKGNPHKNGGKGKGKKK